MKDAQFSYFGEKNIKMRRDKAIQYLHQYIKNENIRKHCLAAGATVRAAAIKLGEDEEKWALAGLMHHLGAELVNADPKTHGLETARTLEEKGVDPEIIEAIILHNEKAIGLPSTKVLHHALSAGETITGLIIATTMVCPDKKLANVKPNSGNVKRPASHWINLSN